VLAAEPVEATFPVLPIKLSASLRAESTAIAAAAVSRSTRPVRGRAGNRIGLLRAADRAAGLADIHVADYFRVSQYSARGSGSPSPGRQRPLSRMRSGVSAIYVTATRIRHAAAQ
jgi:hypothetical protein